MNANALNIDALAQEIRRIGFLAEALAPYIIALAQPSAGAVACVSKKDLAGIKNVGGENVAVWPACIASDDDVLLYTAPQPDARDAARYRGLIASGAYSPGVGRPTCPWALRMSGQAVTKAELDAAIDAAIAGAQP